MRTSKIYVWMGLFWFAAGCLVSIAIGHPELALKLGGACLGMCLVLAGVAWIHDLIMRRLWK